MMSPATRAQSAAAGLRPESTPIPEASSRAPHTRVKRGVHPGPRRQPQPVGSRELGQPERHAEDAQSLCRLQIVHTDPPLVSKLGGALPGGQEAGPPHRRAGRQTGSAVHLGSGSGPRGIVDNPTSPGAHRHCTAHPCGVGNPCPCPRPRNCSKPFGRKPAPASGPNGVNLARSGAVALQSRTASEIELRVRAAGRSVALTVVLYPGDEAWECDCPGRVDPCEHVVAAAISLQQAEKQDAPLVTTASRWSRVVYRFTRVAGGLELHRTLAHADGQGGAAGGEPRRADGAARAGRAAAGGAGGSARGSAAGAAHARGAARPRSWMRCSRCSSRRATCCWTGGPWRSRRRSVLPRAVVEDRGGQLVVTVTRDPRVAEVVSPGVALCGDALARLGETSMTGPWLQNLPHRAHLSRPSSWASWPRRCSRSWRGACPVEVRSKRLPPIDRDLKPRILLELQQLEAGLSVLPTLVYGAPPSVRIDNGRMVYLRGAVPLRDEAAEQRLVHQLRDELNLVPGRRLTVQGQEMVRWADKLRRWRGDLDGRRGGRGEPERAAAAAAPGGCAGARGRASPTCASRSSSRWRAARADAQTVDAAAVVRAWTEGLGLVPLEGGGWAPLPRAWLDKNGQRVADLLAARQADGKVVQPRAAGAGRAVRDARAAASAGARQAGAAGRGLREAPAAGAAGGPHRDAAPLPAAGRELARLPARARGSAASSPTTWASGKTLQTLCVLGPRLAGGVPDQRAAQLGRGARSASVRRSRCACTTGPAARWTRPPT